MISEEELARIVFKGIGGEENDTGLFIKGRVVWERPWILDSNYVLFKDYIFSWPEPCAFGMVVDAAEKLDWHWAFLDGWFWFASLDVSANRRITKHEWQDNNPMWAVCMAFKEVLDLEKKTI